VIAARFPGQLQQELFPVDAGRDEEPVLMALKPEFYELIGPAVAARLVDHGRQAYAAARRIETLAEVRSLRVVKDSAAPG
jgi:hypothetical protein